ncbi:MAG: hypothetical protein PHW69_08315 [Elusimicrobiaceae bacterium]|nr:hypothetical protein [Elusimicrobiaceae bacterium]
MLSPLAKIPHELLFPGFILLIFIIAYTVARRRADLLKRLESVFPGRTFLRWFVPTFEGMCDAFAFSVRLTGGGKNNPPRLNVIMRAPVAMRMTIRKEGAFFSIGKSLGLLKDVRINDPLFDSEFIISAADDDAAVRYLSASGKKDGIRRVFNAGYALLTFKDGEIKAEKTYYTVADIGPDALADVVRSLAVLARDLQ